MLKKVLATVALMGVAVLGAQAQGTVEFKTSGTDRVINQGTGAPMSGTEGMAQLYAAAGLVNNEASLQPVGSPVNFRAGVNAGLINGPVVTIPFAAAGGPVTLQIRAWAGNAASFETASQTGKSALLQLNTTGNPNEQPPTLPASLMNATVVPGTGNGFGFAVVPEPSSIALGILGVAGLALFRRRK